MHKKNLTLLGWLCLMLGTHVGMAETPLPPDQAFKVSASETSPGVIEAVWNIADGYYLYRDKFRFESISEEVLLAQPSYPKGKIKEDPNFGSVETYRHTVAIQIPVTNPGGAQSIELQTMAQGCADLGLCYPPQKKTLTVSLAPTTLAAPAPSAASKLNVLSQLNDSLSGSQSDPLLPPDQAFAFSARLEGGDTVVAEWQIADGYYLYRDKLRPSVLPEGLSLGTPDMPEAMIHADPAFGEVAIWRGPVSIRYPVTGSDAALKQLKFDIKFQGCADQGVCYPPIHKSFDFGSSSASLERQTATPAAASTAPVMVSEQDAIAGKLAGDNKALTLLTFFGLGLLLAFTPCVFPMIPILSGIIIGEGKNISTRKAFSLALAYVLAMAFTYTVVGVLAGLFGANIQLWFQNPWVLSIFAAIFVLLSLSMFGFYELQMPSAIQSRLTSISNRQEGGKLASAAIMGVLSALIVGPCVTAPLIGALIYIGQTGDALLGGAALFFLSMGMGAPLLAIGASAGKLLPRAGIWMEAVKSVFGVLMLGVAIWLLERILPVALIQAAAALLLICSAVYMGAISQLPEKASGWRTLWKGVGFAMLIYGAIMLIGAASGSQYLLTPLKGLYSGSASAAINTHSIFRQIKGVDGLNAALADARSAGKPVMLDFYADWCISCKEMEKLTFADPMVRQTLSQALLLQADVTANDMQDQALMKQFGLFGPPAILFFTPDGEEQKSFRVVGFTPAEKFNNHSQQAFSAK